MKKFILILNFLFFVSQISAQYTTDYPFDSAWVDTPIAPMFNIVDLGAIPNDEINDSPYFRMAADSIQHYGTGKLIIPSGLYIVGEQNINPNPNSQEQYYQNNEIFKIEGVNKVIIEGEAGAKIKVADGLHFGSFDPLTGEVYNHQPDTVDFVEHEYIAEIGDIFFIENSTNILFKNIELDGNLQNLIAGGYWGDTGIQLEASGIKLLGSSNILIRNIHTHHHGLDGLEVGFYNLTPSSNPTVTVIENTISEYNGRQGLSWVGGIGLTAYNCKFNHTGKAGIYSKPGAGLDIEAETSICRGGKFIECEFINNTGPGMVSDSGDGGFSTFDNCTFWGTTHYPIWANKPNLTFNNCNIYGTFLVAYGSNTPDLASQFNNCNFEDLPHPEFGVYIDPKYPYLVHLWEPGNNISFTGCSFTANHCKSVKVTLSDFYFNNCTFTHRDTAQSDNEPVCILETSNISNSTFIDEFQDGFNKTYSVQTDSTNVGDCVFMTGEHLKWEDVSTNYDWVLPGKYPMQNTLELLTPSVGETISAGNVYNVTWNFDNPNDLIEIQLFKGCEFLETIENTTENDGLYAWTVSNDIATANDYRIKILNKNNPQDFDFNPTEFSISNPSAGANDIIKGNELYIYPNPFNDRVFISYTLKEKPEKINIKVKNLLGKTISETNIENQNAVGNTEIKLNNFASGLYLLEFYGDLEMLNCFKIIKM